MLKAPRSISLVYLHVGGGEVALRIRGRRTVLERLVTGRRGTGRRTLLYS